MDKPVDTRNSNSLKKNAISSEDLAALIIDALIWAGIVKQEDGERALSIVTEKIEVRKAFGDY